jgi:hypothetical protein
VSVRLRVLSLGAGVQSTTIALMAAHGEITPMPDCAVFADTQSEPQAVYEHLRWLTSPNVLPFPVHIVTRGSLREQIVSGVSAEGRIDSRPPFFTSPDGMLRRQCTHDFKLVPIWRKVRELAGVAPRSPGPRQPVVEQWIGISTDEAQRMKPAHFRWITNRWPLVEAGLSRRDCLAWLERHGYPKPAKSACTFCPYHSDAMWADMRANDPDSWADAVGIDELIRDGNWQQKRGGKWFLHSSRQPLAEAPLTALERGQPDLFGNECEGVCGV